MSRHERRSHDRINKLLSKTREKHADSPLSGIAKILEELLEGVRESVSFDPSRSDDVTKVTNYVEGIVELLPESFNNRFYFDAAVIQSVVEEWNKKISVKLSDNIVPNYGHNWEHRYIDEPVEQIQQQKSTPLVYLIYFPGKDNLDDVELLLYPFLYHELGHNLLFHDDNVLINKFKPHLEKYINSIHLAGISDRRMANTNARNVIADIKTMWTPTADHQNWTHEIAIDIIALWACGPPYLAAFLDEVSDSIDPYRIVKSHHPYAIRIGVLIEVAKRLGWSNYTHELKQIMRGWSKIRPKQNNRYFALSNSELVQSSIECALETCEVMSLPRCLPEDIERVRKVLQEGEVPNFGLDLILAAWLFDCEFDKQGYEKWESETIGKLLPLITP